MFLGSCCFTCDIFVSCLIIIIKKRIVNSSKLNLCLSFDTGEFCCVINTEEFGVFWSMIHFSLKLTQHNIVFVISAHNKSATWHRKINCLFCLSIGALQLSWEIFTVWRLNHVLKSQIFKLFNDFVACAVSALYNCGVDQCECWVRNGNFLCYACIRIFADGWPNLYINSAHDIRGQHVAFLASFSSPAVIFEQISVIYALPRLFVASFTLVLPFFPTGSFERMEEEGDVATAFTMARILSNIPTSRGGPTSLVIYDIHALQVKLPAIRTIKLYFGFCYDISFLCFGFFFSLPKFLLT